MIMSKSLIKRIIITIALLAFAAYSCYESQRGAFGAIYYELFIRDQGRSPDPGVRRYYPENRWGDYQFNPKTILASLDQGKADVFTPLPDDFVDIEYTDIEWAQSDLLRVADALSQKAWNEPLDLNSWVVYSIRFQGDCNNKFGGFNQFWLTYYKTTKTGWETVYTARHIYFNSRQGIARWDGDGEFTVSFFHSWRKIEFMKFKTTAEQAVRIAEENGGKAARLNYDNKCVIDVDGIEDNWLVYYSDAQFSLFINPFTGEVHPPQ
jgi:hypothetical protein